MKLNITLTSLAFSLLLFSCKKTETAAPVETTNQPSTPETGTVELIFEPVLDGKSYYLNTPFITPFGEDLKINDFKFFVSDISLATQSSKEFAASSYPGDAEQNGIYLINFTSPNYNNGNGLNSYKLRFKATVGEFADIRYRMEVPSELNLADITNNPYPVNASNGMYWSWNSGFKYLVVNGTSNSAVASGSNVHLSIGADKACIFNFRSLLLAPNLPKIKVEKDKTTTIKFTFNLMAMLRNTDGSNYSLADLGSGLNSAQVHGGFYSNTLRANIVQCLELDRFINP